MSNHETISISLPEDDVISITDYTMSASSSVYNTWTTNTTVPYYGNINQPTIISAPGTGTYTLPNIYTTDTISISDWGNAFPNAGLHVNGDANFEGDVKIKGKSLIDSLEKIEEKLAILRPNEQLEEKWDELRELRRKYVELEKEIIEKEKVWDILKK